MFRAQKDTNTGVVYDWVKIDSDGTETWVNIPEDMWKREQDWTNEEIESLFSNVGIAESSPTHNSESFL